MNEVPADTVKYAHLQVPIFTLVNSFPLLFGTVKINFRKFGTTAESTIAD